MKFDILKTGLSRNLRDSLRSCGYFGITDRRTNSQSYVRRLSQSQHYPRFHLYITEEGENYRFHLHLDQKQAIYEGAKAHSADYDDDNVVAEAERIKLIIKD